VLSVFYDRSCEKLILAPDEAECWVGSVHCPNDPVLAHTHNILYGRLPRWYQPLVAVSVLKTLCKPFSCPD
jgi:hypothetical protein